MRRLSLKAVSVGALAALLLKAGAAGAGVLVVLSADTAAGTFATGAASFGPTDFDVTAPLTLADPVDACAALANGAAVAGKIVLVNRGTCLFTAKVRHAQDAGAVGVVVAYDVDASPPPGMGAVTGDLDAPLITIPSASVTRTVGLQLNGALAAGTVVVRLFRDVTPPTLSLPATITVEATTPAGAAVSFAVSATDSLDASPLVSCSPSSGNTFALGSTTVTCTATDTAGNSATGTFVVNVVDTTPPTLILPGTVTVNATSPAGAAVSFGPISATDAVGLAWVACPAASGTTFPIGTTTVTCTATDSSGNTASGSFNVVVLGSTQQIDNLTTQVKAVNAKDGVADSLDAKLQNVLAALSSAKAGDKASACNKLDSFINEVRAQTGTGKSLTQADGDRLIAEAMRIKAVIGCA